MLRTLAGTLLGLISSLAEKTQIQSRSRVWRLVAQNEFVLKAGLIMLCFILLAHRILLTGILNLFLNILEKVNPSLSCRLIEVLNPLEFDRMFTSKGT